MQINIPNNWAPRKYQGEAWCYMENGGKRLVEVCHRRWGKDELSLHWTATQCIEKPATYWHMLPKAAQARKAIWLAVNPHTGKRRIDEAFPEEIRRRTNDNEMFIEFKTGAFWHVLGSDNYDNVVGSPPYGVVFSEWALANPSAWGYIEPILLENNGWAMFIYTSRGKNHGWSTMKLAKESDAWKLIMQDVTDTDVFDDDQLSQAKESLVAIYGQDHGNMLFKQEYYNSFEGGMLGSYYAIEMSRAEEDGRITNVPYQPGTPVNVYFDLGNAPNLVMWFGQMIGHVPHVIDFAQPVVTGTDEIARVLREKRYNYGELVLPHDGGNKQMGDAMGREYHELVEHATRIPTRVLPRTDLLPGLSAVYGFIRLMNIDNVKCDTGIDGLYSYCRDWDEGNAKFRDRPKHDWASHIADAFRYMALDLENSAPSGHTPRVITDI